MLLTFIVTDKRTEEVVITTDDPAVVESFMWGRSLSDFAIYKDIGFNADTTLMAKNLSSYILKEAK